MTDTDRKIKDETPPTLNAGILGIRLDYWIPIIFAYCIAAQLFLILCDYLFNYLNLFHDINVRRIWDMAREKSFPTWFSSLQAHALALTVFLIAMVQSHHITRFQKYMWVLIGLFFLWIGIDDFAEIHERLGTAIEHIAEDYTGKGASILQLFLENPSYNWHTFMMPIFAFCGLGITVFLWKKFKQFNLFRYLFLGFSCWAISQCLDYIEGLYVENIPYVVSFYEGFQETFAIKHEYGVTHFFKVLEEELEMFGTTLLWIGFLKYFARIAHGLKIHLLGMNIPDPKKGA